jgi:transcriptional regulator with XRE-family HTH domain
MSAIVNESASRHASIGNRDSGSAHRAKVHQTYLSGVERGVRNPTVMVLAKIAKALGIEADELLRSPKTRSK